MITITGTVSEVAHGTDIDILTVSSEKRKSKIKCDFGELAKFAPGDRVTITLERDGTLFDEREKED